MLLYNSTVSGNCYKARLLLARLGLEYEAMDVSVVHSTRICVGDRGRLTMYDRTRRND